MLTNTTHKIFPIVLFCFGLFLNSPAQQPTSSELSNQANAMSDLSRLGSYRLKGTLVLGSGKHAAAGTLTMEQAQDNTRQEIAFNDYHEIRLVRGNTGYLQRKPDKDYFVLEGIRHFEDLWWVDFPSGAEAGTVSATKVHEIPALCFTVQVDKLSHVRDCFDAATHLLLSRTSGTLEILFLDYHSIGDVHFPGTIRFIDPEQLPVEVRNVTVAKTDFGETEFAPPEGVSAYSTCRHIEAPQLLKKSDPEYPDSAKLAHIQGTTLLKITVGKDGKVSKVTPISGHPLLVQASIEAAKRRIYQPAMCPSGPVEVDMYSTIQFFIR